MLTKNNLTATICNIEKIPTEEDLEGLRFQDKHLRHLEANIGVEGELITEGLLTVFSIRIEYLRIPHAEISKFCKAQHKKWLSENEGCTKIPKQVRSEIKEIVIEELEESENYSPSVKIVEVAIHKHSKKAYIEGTSISKIDTLLADLFGSFEIKEIEENRVIDFFKNRACFENEELMLYDSCALAEEGAKSTFKGVDLINSQEIKEAEAAGKNVAAVNFMYAHEEENRTFTLKMFNEGFRVIGLKASKIPELYGKLQLLNEVYELVEDITEEYKGEEESEVA